MSTNIPLVICEIIQMEQSSTNSPTKSEEKSSLDIALHYLVLFLSNSTYITLLSLILYITSIYLFINLPNDSNFILIAYF